MALTISDIKHAAALACVEVTDEDAASTIDPLNRTMLLIERIQSIDIEGVEPMSHGQPIQLRLREDAVTAPDQRDLFLSLAPVTEKGLYLVPKVIE